MRESTKVSAVSANKIFGSRHFYNLSGVSFFIAGAVRVIGSLHRNAKFSEIASLGGCGLRFVGYAAWGCYALALQQRESCEADAQKLICHDSVAGQNPANSNKSGFHYDGWAALVGLLGAGMMIACSFLPAATPFLFLTAMWCYVVSDVSWCCGSIELKRDKWYIFYSIAYTLSDLFIAITATLSFTSPAVVAFLGKVILLGITLQGAIPLGLCCLAIMGWLKYAWDSYSAKKASESRIPEGKKDVGGKEDIKDVARSPC